MPVMDGIEATRRIRHLLQDSSQPRIIGITGHVTGKFKEEGLKAGVDEILPKPMGYALLEQIVK